ncbi:MAG TPA: glycosyl hydrolase [Hymenobacter sp.]|jgi:mannan endo-1,4-beta-mannosidase|uniref:glycoside hydrolase family 26 protein n=1 Tax=Hymenobacter sp. TaxID=1898978 RepID=UPI002ED9CC77
MRLRSFFLVALLGLAGGTAAAQTAEVRPSDPKATRKTAHLFRNLERMARTNIMFGHQDALAYGIDNGRRWVGDANRSDAKSVTGSDPAVYGWELGHLELDSARNLDAVPFAKIRQYVKAVYKRGGVNTISWHLNNPTNGRTAWDSTNTISKILPGGPYHAQYLTYLDRMAKYLRSFNSGFSKVPVVFRPFHEHTGSWFWWGQKNCTADEYKALWRFTADYLRNTKKVHNLLLAYSASSFTSKEHYLERYPGDEYVDIVGFDTYCSKDIAKYQRELDRQLPLLMEIATEHRKVAALTETGYERLPDANWWTQTLLPTLSKYNLSYVLVWRNGRPDHYYVPFPGHANAEDFKQFYSNPRVLFQNRLAPLNIYSK